MQTGVPKSIVKGKDKQRDIRKIFKILRKVWLNIKVKKIDMYEGIIVQVLLDSDVTEMFINKKIVVKYGFRLQKLKRLVMVRNINRTNNSGGAIIHQVEVNVYYKSYIERIRMDICNLEKINVILEIPQLQAYNLEINQKTEKVKMTRYPPLYRRNMKSEEENKIKKEKRVVILEEEKIVRQTIDDKKDWRREKEVETDHRKIKKIVPKKFLKWKKVFGKVESERIPTRKIWDHAIDLKEIFKPQKERIYSLSKNKRKEVQNFVDDQLRKGYIRPSKFPQMLPVSFVSKKNRSKRIVIDYRSLNKQIVKNNYLLPLITDLIDNMESKRIFTKMDLQQGFNNVRIKEENEWKRVFTIYIGSFEPTVIFFGMINSLAIF